MFYTLTVVNESACQSDQDCAGLFPPEREVKHPRQLIFVQPVTGFHVPSVHSMWDPAAIRPSVVREFWHLSVQQSARRFSIPMQASDAE